MGSLQRSMSSPTSLGTESAAVTMGRITVDPASRVLLVDGEPARLGARAFDLLTALVRQRGRLVGTQELLAAVWPGRVVERNNIEVQVTTLRKLLPPGMLVTVAGRGYLLREQPPPAAPASATATTPTAADRGVRAARPAGPGPTTTAVGLTRLESAVLEVLRSRPGQPVGREVILRQVWPGSPVSAGQLEAHIASLRRKLGRARISTVAGQGYRFHPATPFDDRAAKASTAAPARPLAGSALPCATGSLIGRANDLAELEQRVRDHGLVSLCGPAGIGKTRLALAAAWQQSEAGTWPDGVHWVELAPHARSAAVVTSIAQVVGISLSDTRAATDELVAAMAPLRLLLVLDNCEHLVDAVASLAARLRAQASGVHLLVTSQQRLSVADEQVIEVKALAIPEAAEAPDADDMGASSPPAGSAVELFYERVRAHGLPLDLSPTTMHVVTDLCRRLDGLPLAIELAAARVPILGVQGVRDRLADRLDLLRVAGDAAQPEAARRRSGLRAAFDWSHSLLPAATQQVFRRLSLFEGGFTPALAQEVAADAQIDRWAVLDHLGLLLQRHLITSDGREPPRLRLLDTAQAYAVERLHDAGEMTALRTRHAAALRQHFGQALQRRDQGLLDDYDFADTLAPELPNALSAIEVVGAGADMDCAWALADSAAALLFALGRAQHGLQMLLALRDRDGAAVDAAVRAGFLQRLGRCGSNGRMPHEQVVELLGQAAALSAEVGDRRRQHECLWMQAEALADAAELDAAYERLCAARALEPPDWHPVYGVRRQRVEAMVWVARGDAARALSLLSGALATCVGHRLHRWGQILRSDRAKALLALGRLDEASAAFAQVVERGWREADRINRADALIGQATCEARRDRAAAARRCLRDAALLWKRSGLLLPRGEHVAWVLARLGDVDAAGRWLGAVDRHLRHVSLDLRGSSFGQALEMLPAERRGPALAEGEVMSVDGLMALLDG